MLKENYSFIEKSIHKIILDYDFVGEFLHEIENLFFKKHTDNLKLKNHIFISGLARSGSTLILNLIYQLNNHSSFTYKDMPFIIAPNIWARFFKNSNKNTKLKKRAHNDYIKININSPESFDEIFWKLILKKKYVTKEYLIPTKITIDDLYKYNNLINLICFKNNKQQYLAKNNNLILRLELLLNFFQNSKFILPYRNPLDHAMSLKKQHLLFLKLNYKNKFSKNYMEWLGHYEFGINHKQFKFINHNNEIDINNDDYWIKIWLNYYKYLLSIYVSSINKNRLFFINYDDVCSRNNNYLNNRLEAIGLEFKKNIVGIYENKKYDCFFSENLKEEALNVYNEIRLIENRFNK